MSHTLKLYIPRVLSENKIVLLKGIGALRISYRSAQDDMNLTSLSAPREEIYFVPGDEDRLDPILVKIVELIAKVERDEASELVQSFMQELKAELRGNGFLTFPTIGWIKQDHWGSLFFEPAAEYIAVTRFFGLGQVELPEALSDAEQEVLADLKETVSEKTARAKLLQRRPSERTWGFIISGVLLLLTLLAVLWFNNGTNESHMVNGQGEDPGTQPAELPETHMDKPPAILLSKDSLIVEELHLVDPRGASESRDEDPALTTVSTGSKECVVVVGAFAREGNVTRMIDRLESSDYESVVIQGPRLKKVGVKVRCDRGYAATLRWARQHIDEGAWLYKKSDE